MPYASGRNVFVGDISDISGVPSYIWNEVSLRMAEWFNTINILHVQLPPFGHVYCNNFIFFSSSISQDQNINSPQWLSYISFNTSFENFDFLFPCLKNWIAIVRRNFMLITTKQANKKAKNLEKTHYCLLIIWHFI